MEEQEKEDREEKEENQEDEEVPDHEKEHHQSFIHVLLIQSVTHPPFFLIRNHLHTCFYPIIGLN